MKKYQENCLIGFLLLLWLPFGLAKLVVAELLKMNKAIRGLIK